VVGDHERASELEQGKLLYSEQRCAAGKKGDHAGTSKDGQDRRRRPRGGKKNKPKGDHAGGAANPSGGCGDRGGDADGERRAGRDDTCNNCNCAGHWAKDCPQSRRNCGTAHVAEGDVDTGLFLMHSTVELEAGEADPDPRRSGSTSPGPRMSGSDREGVRLVRPPGFEGELCLARPPGSKGELHLIEIDERRARVVLNTAVEEEIDEWYLDGGATHHMIGCRELFTDLDGDMRSSMRFGDVSKVDIQGVSSVAFEGKNGEQWVLHGVFYIPALKNSIMSLGRLDKDGSEVRIKDGMPRIWD